MSFEQMKTISLVLYGGAALMFLLSVITFFTFRIPQVISFLTGTQERKEVAALRKSGAATVENVGASRMAKKHMKKSSKGDSSRRDSAGEKRQAVSEKIITEELPDFSAPKDAVSSPVLQTPPLEPPFQEPRFAPSSSWSLPEPSPVLVSSEFSPTLSSSESPLGPLVPPRREEAPCAVTQLLSPAPDTAGEPQMRSMNLQPEFELYFYASSIPVE